MYSYLKLSKVGLYNYMTITESLAVVEHTCGPYWVLSWSV